MTGPPYEINFAVWAETAELERRTDWVLRFSPYSRTTRLVHYAVAFFADPNNEWLVSNEAHLAQMARTSLRTFRRAVAQLLEDGYLERIDGDRYRLLYPDVEEQL